MARKRRVGMARGLAGTRRRSLVNFTGDRESLVNRFRERPRPRTNAWLASSAPAPVVFLCRGSRNKDLSIRPLFSSRLAEYVARRDAMRAENRRGETFGREIINSRRLPHSIFVSYIAVILITGGPRYSRIGCVNTNTMSAVCSLYGKSARRWSTIVSISRVSATFGTDSIDAVD